MTARAGLQAIGITFVMSTVLVGCRTPQPSTWPGIRNIGSGDEQTASRPAPRKDKPRWKFWQRGEQRPEKSTTGRVRREPAPERVPGSDFDRAVRLVKAYKFEQAEQLLNKVVEENPNRSEAWRWIGDCRYNLLRFEEAIDAYVRARELDPNNYLALRGKGFAHLHLGRRWYKDYKKGVQNKDNEQAHEALGKAHENFKLSLELLRECMRLVPGDNEAMYGHAMGAEGTSRKLYSNAVVLLRQNKTTKAHAWAERCMDIIDEGIRAAKLRIDEYPEDPNPRALVAGLFYRRAMLLKEFGRTENALIALKKAEATQQSILSDIDADNRPAQQALASYRQLAQQWAGEE